jgi:hypothetical protein
MLELSGKEKGYQDFSRRVAHTSQVFAMCANHRTLARLCFRPQLWTLYQKQKGRARGPPLRFDVTSAVRDRRCSKIANRKSPIGNRQ